MVTPTFGQQIEQMLPELPEHRFVRTGRAWDGFLRNIMPDEETRQSLPAEYYSMRRHAQVLGEMPPMTFDWE